MNAIWAQALREGAVPGLLGGGLSALALAICGKRVTGSAVAPINAISHWVWGDEALHDDEATVRHTPLGLATHMTAAVFWAVLGSRVLRRRPIAGAAAASATAFVVDYTITPRRLRPGYEHRLDRTGMFAVYAALAAGFAAGALLQRD
jgi:hypothetical protein